MFWCRGTEKVGQVMKPQNRGKIVIGLFLGPPGPTQAFPTPKPRANRSLITAARGVCPLALSFPNRYVFYIIPLGFMMHT